MSNRTSAALMVPLLAFASVARTAVGAPPPAPAMDAARCEQLAELPNAPMSVETCRTLMRIGEDDPGSHRPGDATMSCAQIHAELRSQQGEGVSAATAARTATVIGDGRALGALHAAEMAKQMTPSPLAIASSLLPNAVGALLMAPEQARQVAAMKSLAAADQRYSAQLGRHLDANAADIGPLLDANPRLPRLLRLAMDQDCEPPQD